MARSPRHGMLPSDLYDIVTVSDPQLSPDGTRAVFVATRMDRVQNAYRSAIWSTDLPGGPLRRLTGGLARDRSPRWSPDGRYLAFVSDRSGTDQLWILPMDGGEPWKLTSMRDRVASPSWSPDSTRLAYLAQVVAGTDPLVERDPGAPREPPKVQVVERLKYKFNGEGFRDHPAQLFVVALPGGRPRQLTVGDVDVEEPAWAPAGDAIAVASAREPERDYDSISDIWVVSAADGTLRKVTKSEGPASTPSWSPDGQRIAYVGHTHPEMGGGYNQRLRLVSAEGGDSRTLTDRLDRSLLIAFRPAHVPPPRWTADGQAICFLHQDRGAVVLGVIRAQGGETELVAGGARSINAFDLGRDGRTAVFTASAPANPGEVFTVDTLSRVERQLTQLNAGWLSAVELSVPERVEVHSQDGTPIDTWIMRPVAFQPGRRYPALVNVHGGPHAQYGWNFFDEFQIQAGAGYVVIFGNPRGSQGYGEEFALVIRGDWGHRDYADVMAITDSAAREPYVDADRMGILGGSYGGYMTSWVIGHTPRFKAAVSERAVNNLFSQFGCSDVGALHMADAWGGTPQEIPQKYLDRSPVMYVEQVHTPLLILHSEADLRCEIEQGEQLYTALKRLRREVRMVRFPGESHEMSRSGTPQHRVERFQHILDWFAAYLGVRRPDVRPARTKPQEPAKVAPR